jgi:hypothetical protein
MVETIPVFIKRTATGGNARTTSVMVRLVT